MSRKKYLPEGEIQKLEQLTPMELRDHLGKLSSDETFDLFQAMLVSYRVAARVANMAWAVKDGVPCEEFERALHDYAPNNFPPHLGDLEVLCDELESLLQMHIETREDLVREIELRLAQYRAWKEARMQALSLS